MTDNVFRQAGASKFVVLCFVPGIETPQWALDRIPAGSKQNFCIPYGLKSDVGTQITLPEPWDETYLNLWYDFLKAVSQRYADNPRFLMIAAHLRLRGDVFAGRPAQLEGLSDPARAAGVDARQLHARKA
jgi:hypothetical protein